MLSGRADILVGSDRPDPGYNPGSLAIIRSALATDYRPIFKIKVGSKERIVYKRVEQDDFAKGSAEAAVRRAPAHRTTG
jgi:hypothetical protein